MATYHVKTTGSGTGVGSEADPFTWNQLESESFSAGDFILVYAGTHTASATWTPAVQVIVRGVRSGARPVIDYDGSGTVIDPAGNESVFEYLEFDDASSTRTIDYDVIFRPTIIDCKGKFFDGRGGGRSGNAIRIEATDTIQVGNEASITNCYADILIVDGQSSATFVSNVVTGNAGTGNNTATFFQNNIFIGGGATASVRFDEGVVEDCIFVDNTNATNVSGFARFANCLYFGNTTKHSGSGDIDEYNATDMAADPFEDSGTQDLRLTTAAQSQSYISSLVRIMLCHLNTPGITMNTEAELLAMVGGGGSSNFDPYKSAFYRV